MENEKKVEGTMMRTSTTQVRPGRETSEFWVTVVIAVLLVVGAGVGFMLGKLDYVKAMEVLGLGLGILGFGYAGSRGLAKQGPKNLMILALVGSMFLLTACGQTFRGVLGGIHKGARAISQTYEPEVQRVCIAKATACKGKVTDVEQCKPYVECRAVQRKLALGMTELQRSIKVVASAHQDAVKLGLIGGAK